MGNQLRQFARDLILVLILAGAGILAYWLIGMPAG
jgi:hypothetical protein